MGFAHKPRRACRRSCPLRRGTRDRPLVWWDAQTGGANLRGLGLSTVTSARTSNPKPVTAALLITSCGLFSPRGRVHFACPGPCRSMCALSPRCFVRPLESFFLFVSVSSPEVPRRAAPRASPECRQVGLVMSSRGDVTRACLGTTARGPTTRHHGRPRVASMMVDDGFLLRADEWRRQ